MDQTLVTRIVEGALLAASQPLTVAQLSALFTLDEPAPCPPALFLRWAWVARQFLKT